MSDKSSKVTDILLNQIKGNKLASGYLLYGPGEKDKTATIFAKILLCQGNKKPCRGECCQMFNKGIQSDFIIVEREKGDTKIKIERVREIRRNVSMRAAGRRVVLIRKAELLSIDAANALLKTLEEPSSNTVFILTTSNIKEVIPTIVSRCQGLYLDKKTNIYPHTFAESHTCKGVEVYRNHGRGKKVKEFLKGDLISRFLQAKQVGEKKGEGLKFLNSLERVLRSKMLAETNDIRRKRIAREILNVTQYRLLLKRNISARLILEDLSLRLENHQ